MSDDPKKKSDDSSPFAQLRSLRDSLPPGPALAPRSRREQEERGPSRAVVRLERKGRGGKSVTVVEQLGLAPAQLAVWLKALQGALGCGGTVEGEALVLQGDHRERTRQLLAARGVRKVSAG